MKYLAKSDRIFKCVLGLMTAFAFLMVLYPLIYVVSASFSEPSTVTSGQLWLFPVKWSVRPYELVFKSRNLITGFCNSLIYTVAGTVVSLVVTVLAAYPLSRPDLKGKNLFILFFSFTMIFSGGMIPSYLVVQSLGLLNTMWSLILPGALSIWNMVIMRTYFQSTIPNELYEAACLDGCTDFKFLKETDKFTSFKGFYPFYRQDMDYFCDMITEPERLMEENEYQLKEQLKNAGRFVKAMKNYAGAVCLGGDLGGQDTPMCRPESFEKIVMPYLKVFTDFIHRNSDMKIFLHTCGAVEPLIPLLIESGIDILNPVQISAKGMEPRVLKQKYGKDIVFWGGGADTQTVLGMKPGSAVAENVRYLMNCFKPGGGYVFTPVHNIMGNIRPEDILTVYDTAYREGFY